MLKEVDRPKMDRYIDGRADLFTGSAEAVRATGFYELVRNWRIAAELAETAGISNRLLLNLGPDRLNADVQQLASVLASGTSRLEHVRWSALVGGGDHHAWFADYVTSRHLDEF